MVSMVDFYPTDSDVIKSVGIIYLKNLEDKTYYPFDVVPKGSDNSEAGFCEFVLEGLGKCKGLTLDGCRTEDNTGGVINYWGSQIQAEWTENSMFKISIFSKEY